MATQFDPIAKDESLNTTEVTPRNIADVLAEGLKGIEDALPTYTEGDGIDLSNNEISVDTTFTEASTRANIASGDTLATIWGKIKKFFTDLKAVAFSGASADVTYGSGSVKDALDGLTNDIGKKNVSVTAATGYDVDGSNLITMNGILLGHLLIYKTSGSFPVGSFTKVGTISDYNHSVAIQIPAINTSNGDYVGIIYINTSGEINVYTKQSSESWAYGVCVNIL